MYFSACLYTFPRVSSSAFLSSHFLTVITHCPIEPLDYDATTGAGHGGADGGVFETALPRSTRCQGALRHKHFQVRNLLLLLLLLLVVVFSRSG